MKAADFLTGSQKEAVTEAIRKAERGTSGEIRVHIDERCDGNPLDKAADTFRLLKMDRTEQHHGVLIYVACESKVFAIVGDSGINKAVPDNFWDDVAEAMHRSFAEGDFAGGLEKAVLMTGEKLKEHFPYLEGDINELPDDISFGDGRKS